MLLDICLEVLFLKRALQLYLPLFLVHNSVLNEHMTNVVDAIARLSHVLDFIARAVGDAGVRHGVAVVTVRLQLRISRSPRRHLQENGSFALRADGSRATHRLAHGEDIVSVGLDSRDVVLSHLVVLGGGGRALR